MVVIATSLIGKGYTTLRIAVMRRARVVVVLMVAHVDVVECCVDIGLMVATLASEGHNVACRQY